MSCFMISGTKSWFYDNFTFITHSTVHTYIHIMIIQICFSISLCQTQMTAVMNQDNYRDGEALGEEKYIVDDCGWLGTEMYQEAVIRECGDPWRPANCTSVENGIKARSHQHQWQVLVGDESEECEQQSMNF